MASSAPPAPRRGITLTQQIFIGLAIGIVAGWIVSTTHPDRVTVDAGIKAFSTDVADRHEAKNWPGIVYNRAGDEFGAITADGGTLPRIGDRLEFIIPHCDPTVNLYDRLYVLAGDKVEDVWRIAARRE